MTEKQLFPDLTPEERAVFAQVAGAAETIQPDERFVKQTEAALRYEFAAKKENRMKRFNFIWQSLAGATAIVALTLLLVWLVKGVAPEIQVTPVPAINGTPQLTIPVEATPLPTATPALPAYDYAGSTLYRAVDFPAAPAKLDLYAYSSSEQAATVDSAGALAQRLGIDGQVYSGEIYSRRYLVSDGQQLLFVNSDQDFLYFSSSRNLNLETLPDVPLDKARQMIEAYLATHSFDFNHKIQAGSVPGWFLVIPVTADGLPIYFGSSPIPGLSLAISQDGQISQMQANLLAAGGESLGKFAILSAEEAWQKILDPSPGLGISESDFGGSKPNPQSWNRTYPDNQPMTLYCGAIVYPAIASGQPPLITCDNFVLSGKTAGLEDLKASSTGCVAIQGQFTTEAGMRTFQVESWEKTSLQKQYLSGGEVGREGDQVIYTVSGTDYLIRDVPDDFPIPAKDVGIAGAVVDNVLEWDTLGIHLFWGGSGGGGGLGFAKLNLSGTPVPWPTPEPIVSPTPSTFIGQRLDGVRGTLRMIIYQKADGNQVKEYNFLPKADANYTAYLLQGSNLAQLDNNNNRPVDIWGAVTGYSPVGAPILTVERSAIPYPDLKFQFLIGKQKLSKVAGQDVILFKAENGKTYVQFSGDTPDSNLMGAEGDLVRLIVLLIPDETFGGYPVARSFGGGPASDTANKQKPEDMPGGPDKPFVISGDSPSTSALPTLTVDNIDLGYYIADPHNPPSAGAYLQPVWRFYGHYSNGDFFEFLVQALRPEYLYPEAEQTGN
jgi:hypothetical protein